MLRSTPSLTSGDLDTLSKEAFETAGRIRLVIVADVLHAMEADRYSLDRVGVGLSAPATGDRDDVIVTTSAVGGSKGAWSTKERIILAAGSYELSQAELVVATPTLALVRMPTTSLVADSHKKLSLIYALLVDPVSGRLRTFVWQEDAEAPPQSLVELDAPAVVVSKLDVKARRLAGIPVTWSFAMTNLPGEIERTVTPELSQLILPDRLESGDPGALEAALIEVASKPPVVAPGL